MSDIEVVVFDIGNVLIEWQPERFYDGAIGEEKRRALFDAVDLLGTNERVDMGENFTALFTQLAEENADWSSEIMMWHDRWIEMAAPAIDHSVRLLRALRRRKIPVFALSNFGVETFEIARAEYPFLEEFDEAFVSGHMGLMKPDPKIYEEVETKGGKKPSTILFADDRPENVAAAATRGWKAHLFENPEGFAARLVAEGLLMEADAR